MKKLQLRNIIREVIREDGDQGETWNCIKPPGYSGYCTAVTGQSGTYATSQDCLIACNDWQSHPNKNCKPVIVKNCNYPNPPAFSGGGAYDLGCITIDGQEPKVGDVIDWTPGAGQSWDRVFVVAVGRACEGQVNQPMPTCDDWPRISPGGQMYGGCSGGCVDQLWANNYAHLFPFGGTTGPVTPQGDAIIGCKSNPDIGPLQADDPFTTDPLSKKSDPEIDRMKDLANIKRK